VKFVVGPLRLTSRVGIREENGLHLVMSPVRARGELMPESTPAPARRPKRFLSAEQKYEIWMKVLTGELSTQQAAIEAGVDRSTIMALRKTAKDGAIAALQAARPGRPAMPGRRASWLG
jgi:hypothetical protein